MSDANRVELRYVEETTFGATPSSPTLTAVRFTSEDLRIEPTTVTSQELRADRQIADLILTNLRAAGSIPFEWSYKSQDWAFYRGLQADAAFSGSNPSAVDDDSTINLAIAGNIITSSGSTGYNWTTNGYAVGKWVRGSGWANTPGTWYGKIAAANATSIQLTHVTLVDETGASGATIELIDQITNGTTFKSFAIQRRYADLANEFVMFNGMAPDTISMNVSASGVVTGSVGFLGKTEASATAEPASTTNAASAGDGNPIFNATSNVPRVLVAAGSYPIRTASWTIQNNLRPREQVGTLGAVSVGSGTVSVTGTIEAYYESKAEYDKLVSQTASSLAIVFEDVDGNSVLWEFPEVKYSTGSRVGSGINTDVLATLQFTAYRDPTEAITVRYGRWDA